MSIYDSFPEKIKVFMSLEIHFFTAAYKIFYDDHVNLAVTEGDCFVPLAMTSPPVNEILPVQLFFS